MQIFKMGLGAFVTFVLCTSLARAETLIFDDSNTGTAATHQVPPIPGADYGPGARITVAADTPISNIGVFTYQQSGGNLKFFIYDETTSSFPIITAPEAFSTAYFDPAVSPAFNYTLLATDVYDIGAISDSDTYYEYGYTGGGATTYTQNGITAPVLNILVQNYTNPAVKTASGAGTPSDPGVAQIALQLYDSSSATPLPKPIFAGVFLLGILGVSRVYRRGESV